MTVIDRRVRFIEMVQLTPNEAQLLVKVPLSAHREVNAVCERLHYHPLRLYREAFDRGLISYLANLRRGS